MRTMLAAAAIVAVLTPLPLAAQDRKSDWPEGSAMHTAYLMAERGDAATAQLEARHAELLALVEAHRSPYMGTRVPAALQAGHAAWPAYRSAACELFGALTGAGGTWPTTHALDCEAQLTEQRLADVTAALACIRALPVDEREFGQAGCLAPLAPDGIEFGEG
jgi:uncharacterized protein YecT (DUF1311 family)